MDLPFKIYLVGSNQSALALSESTEFQDGFKFKPYPGGSCRTLALPGIADAAFQTFTVNPFVLVFCSYRVYRYVKLVFRDILPGMRLYMLQKGNIICRDSPLSDWYNMKMNTYRTSTLTLNKREVTLLPNDYQYLIVIARKDIPGFSISMERISLHMLRDLYQLQLNIMNNSCQDCLLYDLHDLFRRALSKEKLSGAYLYTPQQAFEVYRSGINIQKYIDESSVIQTQFKKIPIARVQYDKAFKYFWGLAPKQFQIKQRMKKAFYLLKTNKMTVSAIAIVVGYKTVSDFVRGYFKYYGHRPEIDRRELK